MPDQVHVVIAGAGPAGVEAALRLQRIARRRVHVTIVAPEPRRLQLPPAVASPFGVRLTAQPPLKDGLAPVILRRGSIASVSTAAREVHLDDGGLISYDALLVAVGGRARAPFRRAITYGMPGSEARMHGLVQDLETGYVKRVAFVVPPSATWPLPVYELALMTAERAFDMCAAVQLTLVTPERRVLDGLGDAMSDEVTSLLDAAEVTIRPGSQAVMTGAGALELRPSGERLDIDRVVTLPVLEGPALDGLPHDDAGFLIVDGHGRVAGAPDIYAAGDVTAYAIKQGGIACQQADAAVDAILADAGIGSDPQPVTPVLRGALRTNCALRRFQFDPVGAGELHAPEGEGVKFAGEELSRFVHDVALRR